MGNFHGFLFGSKEFAFFNLFVAYNIWKINFGNHFQNTTVPTYVQTTNNNKFRNSTNGIKHIDSEVRVSSGEVQFLKATGGHTHTSC